MLTGHSDPGIGMPLRDWEVPNQSQWSQRFSGMGQRVGGFPAAVDGVKAAYSKSPP